MTTPGSTWTYLFSNLELTNVFLCYVNELCIYLKFCLSSSQFQLRLRTNNGSANQYVLLIQLFSDVMESVYLIGNLPLNFKIHVSHFMAPHPQNAFWDNIGTMWVTLGHKWLTWVLKKGRLPIKYILSLT